MKMETVKDAEKLAINFYDTHKKDLINDCVEQADVVQEAVLHFLECKLKDSILKRQFILDKLYEMLATSQHRGLTI